MSVLEENKSELISSLCSYADTRHAKAPDGVDLPAVMRNFYRHVAPEDLLEREASDLYGAVMAELRLAAERPQGKAAVKVFTPTVSVNGWAAGGHTVVEVVTDDMPFLVDSVSMVLSESQHDIHLVIHPQYVVRRDVMGVMQEILD
ncbi:MAG: NAD-glutamate dehydrogenase, partial [Marmoricola sp.]|nr:NAD-glutamate dehydrogenase [Marmoricola sp.]